MLKDKKNDLENELYKLLKDFRYQSSRPWVQQEKSLMEHHISSLIRDLAPFIEKKIDEAFDKGMICGKFIS